MLLIIGRVLLPPAAQLEHCICTGSADSVFSFSYQATVSTRALLFSIYLFLYVFVELHSGKDSCLTSARVLRLSPRQRGDRSGQRGGEGERSLPAHHRQSTDAVRTVAQAGAARLSISGNGSLCDKGGLCTANCHTDTAARSHNQRCCEMDTSLSSNTVHVGKAFIHSTFACEGVFNLRTLPGNLLQKPNPCRKMEKLSEASRRL